MIEESERRCEWCSKRMMVEIDPYYFGPGTRWIHSCWSCDHAEVEFRRPALAVIQGGRGADRLKRLRLGDSA
jgi:hypothetical protein